MGLHARGPRGGRIHGIKRIASGLLFSDNFNRADGAPGANYVIESGAWTINGGRLRAVGTGIYIRTAAFADRKDYHVQVLSIRQSRDDYATLLLRRTEPYLYLFDHGSFSVDGGTPRLYREAGGYALLQRGTNVGNVNGRVERYTFSVIGVLLGSAHQDAWIDGVLECATTDSNGGNNIVGGVALNASHGAGYQEWDDLIICGARLITCTGLPTGWRLKLGAILSDASIGGAAVKLDIGGTAMPIASVTAIDGNNVPRLSFTPSGGLFGGDTLVYE